MVEGSAMRTWVEAAISSPPPITAPEPRPLLDRETKSSEGAYIALPFFMSISPRTILTRLSALSETDIEKQLVTSNLPR